MTDEYQTISDRVGEGYYTDKRSKFLAFAHNVASSAEAKEIVGGYRKKYHDARHVCYAYVLGFDGTRTYSNDDGEPSRTAGKPILGQINSRGITNVLVVVVRYYGGINLGTGGLVVAYRTAAMEALGSCDVIIKRVEEEITLTFAYPAMNDVMRVVKTLSPTILKQCFANTCTMTLSIRKGDAWQIKKRLLNVGVTLLDN